MNSFTKRGVLAAAVGAVAGAGAVIATVIAMKDQKNKKKVNTFISNAKDLIEAYKSDAADQVEDGRENIKKMANQAINKAETITKSVKKEIKKI